jgi:hypothetical protein
MMLEMKLLLAKPADIYLITNGHNRPNNMSTLVDYMSMGESGYLLYNCSSNIFDHFPHCMVHAECRGENTPVRVNVYLHTLSGVYRKANNQAYQHRSTVWGRREHFAQMLSKYLSGFSQYVPDCYLGGLHNFIADYPVC